MSEAPVQPGEIIAGKYRVERLVGVGGMGVVVAAWHQELEQRVAVKFLLQDVAARPDAAERFRREARTAAKIRSEHVGRVLDVGTHEAGVPYLVMEFLEGHDLATELQTTGPLPVEEAVDYVLQACEAVAEAHAAGIVHRDLKPSNLFLARRADGSVCVKVLDFGISKNIGGNTDLSLTKTSSLVGSPLYMSPEHMRSAKDVDERADVWAMGVILYELLAGRTPYSGQTVTELVAMMMTEPPAPLRAIRRDVPAELEAVILATLERDRNRRIPSIAELAGALVPFAPLRGAVHAERAARVLSSSDLGRAVGDGTLVSRSGRTPVGSRTPVLGSRTPAEGAPPADPSTEGLEHAATVAEFGRTDGQKASAVPARRPAMLWGVAGLGFLAAGAYWAFGRDVPRDTAAPHGAPVAAVQEVWSGAAVDPAASVERAPAPPTASASAAPESPAPSASVSGGSRSVRPARGAPAPRVAPTSTTGITDFGGRR